MTQPTILLVEDDAASRYATARHLTESGFRVVEAETTLSALAQVEAGLVADCLVADIHMPTGVPHGVALANMLRARKPDLAVIFVTAYADMANVTRDMWGGGSVFPKPVDLAQLTTEIHKKLERKGPG